MRAERLFGAAALLLLIGCRANSSAAGLAGLPPAGSVRILARKLRENGRTYQWQWTIIGDRNWRSASGDGWRFRLNNSYPLNSTTGSGGTHIWEFTATVEEQATGLRREFSLRGSNAGQFKSSGVVGAQGATLGQVVRTLQVSDVTLAVPAHLSLVRVGGQTVELAIDP